MMSSFLWRSFICRIDVFQVELGDIRDILLIKSLKGILELLLIFDDLITKFFAFPVLNCRKFIWSKISDDEIFVI